jgi:hypothetical protein
MLVGRAIDPKTISANSVGDQALRHSAISRMNASQQNSHLASAALKSAAHRLPSRHRWWDHLLLLVMLRVVADPTTTPWN